MVKEKYKTKIRIQNLQAVQEVFHLYNKVLIDPIYLFIVLTTILKQHHKRIVFPWHIFLEGAPISKKLGSIFVHVCFVLYEIIYSPQISILEIIPRKSKTKFPWLKIKYYYPYALIFRDQYSFLTRIRPRLWRKMYFLNIHSSWTIFITSIWPDKNLTLRNPP